MKPDTLLSVELSYSALYEALHYLGFLVFWDGIDGNPSPLMKAVMVTCNYRVTYGAACYNTSAILCLPLARWFIIILSSHGLCK